MSYFSVLPVVASDLPSLRYIFNKSGAGVAVKADDVKAYVQAIGELLDDPEKANELGLRGRAFVEKNYNWDVEAKRLIDYYRKSCFHFGGNKKGTMQVNRLQTRPK